MHKRTALSIATLGGCGYFPLAPGTVGSAVTLPFVMVIAYYWGFIGVLLSTIFLFFLGIYTVRIATQYEGEHDPSHIVIDEAMGQFCTFLPIAWYLEGNMEMRASLLYGVGFFFFRLFDALKPQPARWADSSLHSAWGVMLDDFFASIYSAICVYGVYRYFLV